MEDSRSFESQEEMEQRMERSDDAVDLESSTFEPEARVEAVESFEQAEAVQAVFEAVVAPSEGEGARTEAQAPGSLPGDGLQDPDLSSEDAGETTDDLALIALQQRLQRKSRQVEILSNVMEASHDTEKSVISNIRS